MGLRHLGRELALKALYRDDICGGASTDELSQFFQNFPADERARRFAADLVEGVRREAGGIDRTIADVLEHWSIRRLSRVDHNILRLAVYELRFCDDIPARVSIDEAIELAKVYGDSESARFVNGVLDQAADLLGVKGKGEGSDAAKSD
jgi:transcription antitermination protein NusB